MAIDSYFWFDDNDNKTTISTNIFKITKRGIDMLNTHISIHCMIDNWENGLNLRRTLDESTWQPDMFHDCRLCNVQKTNKKTNEYDSQAKMRPVFALIVNRIVVKETQSQDIYDASSRIYIKVQLPQIHNHEKIQREKLILIKYDYDNKRSYKYIIAII